MVAAGQKYIEEARESLSRLKNEMPEISATLFTDREIEEKEHIDDIRIDENMEKDFSAKIRKMNESPYEKTLFLDTDVKVKKDFSEIFETLKDFQMSFAFKNGSIDGEPVYEDYHMSYNTGVIAYRNEQEVDEFFQDWLDEYDQQEDIHDQPSFVKTIIESDIRYITLPFEYNMRLHLPSYASHEIKIFHFRKTQISELVPPRDIDKLMEKANNYIGRRVMYTRLGGLGVKTHYSRTRLLKRGIRRLKKEGVFSTAKLAIQRIKSGKEIFQ